MRGVQYQSFIPGVLHITEYWFLQKNAFDHYLLIIIVADVEPSILERKKEDLNNKEKWNRGLSVSDSVVFLQQIDPSRCQCLEGRDQINLQWLIVTVDTT